MYSVSTCHHFPLIPASFILMYTWIWVSQKASYVWECQYSSKANCPYSLLKNDDDTVYQWLMHYLCFSVSWLVAKYWECSIHTCISHCWANSSVSHFLFFSGISQSWHFLVSLHVFPGKLPSLGLVYSDVCRATTFPRIMECLTFLRGITQPSKGFASIYTATSFRILFSI